MVTELTGAALSEALAARLAGEADVLVAYLFGSQARGTPSPLSDVDVAVLLAPGWSFDRHLEHWPGVCGERPGCATSSSTGISMSTQC